MCQRSAQATFSLSRDHRAVYAVFHIQQLGQLGVEGFVLDVSGIVFMLERAKLALLLCGVDAVGELAAG